MSLITVSEYARRHNRKPVSARTMAERGRFTTAVKLGKTWFIDSDEPYPDARRLDASSTVGRSGKPGSIPVWEPAPWTIPLHDCEQWWLRDHTPNACLVYVTGLHAFGLDCESDIDHELHAVTPPSLDAFLFHQHGKEHRDSPYDIIVSDLEDTLNRMRRCAGATGLLTVLPDAAILYADDLGCMVLELRRRLLTVEYVNGLLVSADHDARHGYEWENLTALACGWAKLRCVTRLIKTGRVRLDCTKQDIRQLQALREASRDIIEHEYDEYRKASVAAWDEVTHCDRLCPALTERQYRLTIRPVLIRALEQAMHAA